MCRPQKTVTNMWIRKRRLRCVRRLPQSNYFRCKSRQSDVSVLPSGGPPELMQGDSQTEAALHGLADAI